jgi:asparagine synthase (glutamine-hydrolysing)
MCGILAVVGGPLPVAPETAEAALDLLRHRGPDDRGVWTSDACWLGSRRLAILDTSTRGHQPMVDEASGAVIVFNGEIYNYVELRDELERDGVAFRSGCDTEVLLKAYVQWGTETLARLNGMWAFAIWDPSTRSVFFARDRLGVKPYAYTLAQERLSLASEPKALLALYPQLRRADEQSLYEFLALGRLHASNRSMYDGVSVLPPGHAGVFRVGDDKPRIWRYWSLPAAREPDDGDPVERFSELLGDAIRLRMRSDVPVGVTVSGGLDSTAVLHGAATSLPDDGRLRAFTSVFATNGGPARDERQWAEIAARPYSRVALEHVPVAANWLETLERMMWHLDAPTSSPAAASLWTIVQAARSRGIKVLLEGQGADELLGGYVQYAALALARNGGTSAGERIRAMRRYAATFGPSTIALWTARERFPRLRHLYRTRRGTGSTLSPAFAGRFPTDTRLPATSLGQRLIDDLSRDVLPALLHYGDAVSMAHSVETRQPFLDYRLVEFSTALPDDWKVGHGETKRILRAHLRAIGHQRIAERSDKLGFPTPVWSWLMADDARVSHELLLDPNARVRPYCSRSQVAALIARARRERRTGADHLFRLLATEIWLRRCIG